MKIFKTAIVVALSFLTLSSCSHSIKIRSSYFVTPTTSENQWGGSIGIAAAKPSVITLVDDVSTNPPVRNGVRINDASDVNAVTFVDSWTDIKLSVLKSFEITYTDHVLGAKWQFLNHNAKEAWVASVVGGYGMKNTESSTSTGKYKTQLSTTRAGVSVGYKTIEGLLPYGSILYQKHNTDTTIDNSFGAFGSYLDEGIHYNYALGLSTSGKGFNFAVEYNYITMLWNDTSSGNHGVLGFMLGYEW